MVNSDTQILESGMNLSSIKVQKNSETDFSKSEETEDVSIIEKITDKFDVKVRFARLRKRMRNRSSNIL